MVAPAARADVPYVCSGEGEYMVELTTDEMQPQSAYLEKGGMLVDQDEEGVILTFDDSVGPGTPGRAYLHDAETGKLIETLECLAD